MIRKELLAVLGLSLALATGTIGQSPSETKSPRHVAVAPASAREADVSTIEGIVKAYYDKKNARSQQQANAEPEGQPSASRAVVATVGAQQP